MKRLLTLTLLTLVFSFLPYAFVDAASYPSGLIPCDGPECQACHFLQLGQNLITWFIGIMATLAALIVAFAGFKMLTSGGNSGKVSAAKEMMTNVVIGFIIVLAAWIIVDTVMKLFLKQDVLRGPWYQIECVPPPPYVPPSTAGTPGTPTTPPVQGGGGVTTGSGAQCAAGNTACSVSALQQVGFDQKQANVMSCIAVTESSGNPSTPPYNVTHPGSNSSACGTFQITRTTWNTSARGSCADFSMCTNAACNAQVAQTLVSSKAARGANPYSDWTCANCNSKAQACIDRYGK